MSKPLNVFITYSHNDTRAKEKLITCLAVMKREGLVKIWHDNEILGGDIWREEIFSTNLPNSDILLYLVSAESLASENCNKELAIALDEKIRVIPIILEDCDWQNHKLSDFQALPDKGKPINDINEWNPESKGWKSVTDGIRKVIKKMQSDGQIPFDPSRNEIIAESMFQRSNFLLMLGLVDIALEAYTDTIKLKPDYAGVYFNRGVTYGIKGEFNLAIKDYNTAIDLKQDYADTYYNRGIAYSKKGEVDLAIKDFTKVIQLNPDDANALNNRGIAYNDKGEHDKAIMDYTKAIELNPGDAKFYKNRGNAYGCINKYDLAIEDHSNAINLKSDDANAYNNRGVAYSKKGEVELAIKDFTKAIQLNPDFAEAYNNRGVVYGYKGELDCAITEFEGAIDRNPNYADAYSNCGNACRERGEYERAIENYSEAIRFEPENAHNPGSYHYNRGLVWLILQEWNKAKDDLTTARDKQEDVNRIEFNKEYEYIADFEQEHNITLPADIAAMLTPPST